MVGRCTADYTVAGRLAENQDNIILVAAAGVGNSHEIKEITTHSMDMDLIVLAKHPIGVPASTTSAGLLT